MIDTTGKTLQEVSDEIAAKLIEQGERCVNSSGYCQYSNDKGQHCAVGWLLPEDDPRLMSTIGSVNDLLTFDNLGVNDAFIRKHCKPLKWLQAFHDEENANNTEEYLDPCQSNIEHYDLHGLDFSAWEGVVEVFEYDNLT